MNKHLHKQKGVFLIFVLAFIVILVMFASIGITLVTNTLHNSSYFYRYQSAVSTAEAGIQYAISRISTDKYWAGYNTAGTGLNINQNGLEIIEHYLGDNTGCVEGKITMGEHTSYFDIYFKKPPTGTTLSFFGTDAEAGPIPERIIMSKNNTVISAVSPVYYYDNPSNPIINRIQPKNSVLLACRGKSGNIERTVEVVVGMKVDLNNTVAWARNNFDVTIWGPDNRNKLILGDQSETSPSYVRSGKRMEIGIPSEMLEKRGNDFLSIFMNSGGECNNDPIWRNNIPPSNGRENFIPKDGQDNVPALTLEEALKHMNADTNSSDFPGIEPGTYEISSNSDNKDFPVVKRYTTDNITKIHEVESKDITQDFKTRYIDSNIMSWNNESNKLTINRSFKTNSNNSANSLKNLNFISNSMNSVSIQLGPGKVGDTLPKPTYLLNNNGNVHVEGQLSGIGTVICAGDLSMQAESVLLTNPDNGLNVYSGGNVTINEIKNSPVKTAEQKLLEKIWNFIDENKANPDYIHKDVNVDFHDNEECNRFFKQNKAYKERLDSIGYKDIYAIPKSKLTTDEIDLLGNLLETSYTRFDGTQINTTLFRTGEYNGIPLKEESLVVDLSPRSSDTSHSMHDFLTSTGVFRIWYLENRLYESETESTGRFDEKGRPISYKDSIFKGLIYTCKDFTVNSPKHSFILEGGLIAFGGDTQGNKDDNEGSIIINAADCRLLYNDQYLQLLSGGTDQLSILYWTNY